MTIQEQINAEAERRYPIITLNEYLADDTLQSHYGDYGLYAHSQNANRNDFIESATFALSLIPEPTADMQADAELMFPASTGIPSELQNDYNEQTQRDRDNYLLGRTHQPQPSADMQADAEALYPYTNPKTPQNNAVVDRERAAYLKGCMRQSGWVSVEDNTPKAGQTVLLWVDVVSRAVSHVYTSTGQFKCMEQIVLPKYYEAEFWMPLPSKP